METALEARLLAEDGPDRYRFTHDLIRETVENGLSAARRRRLHRRIGQALERQPGASAESLAFHFSHSGEDSTAAGYLELAGDQAQQRVAYAAAAEFYAAAAARLEVAGRPAEVAPVTEKQGMAWRRAGRYDAAITALEDALAGYRAADDAEGVARVTGRLANAHYRRGTSHDALGELADMAEGDPAPGTRRGLTRHLDLVGRVAAAAVRAGLVHQDGDPRPVAGPGRARSRQQPDAGHRHPGRGRRADPPGPAGGGRGADGGGPAGGSAAGDERAAKPRPCSAPPTCRWACWTAAPR